MSLLTYQSLPCDLSRRLTAIVFAPLAHANFVPANDEKKKEAVSFHSRRTETHHVQVRTYAPATCHGVRSA